MSGNGYVPVEHPGFGGGLNLRDGVDAIEPEFAIDGLNVEHTARGVVRARAGYARFTALPTGHYSMLVEYIRPAAADQLIIDTSVGLRAFDHTGVEVANLSFGTSAGDFCMARFGALGEVHAWFANGENTLRGYNGGNFFVPNITLIDTNDVPIAAQDMPKPRVVVATHDNRLLACGFDNPNGGPGGKPADASMVYSCEPGDWLRWREDDFFRLRPGDGDEIMAAATWREQTFIFKRKSFFVYTGSSIDGQGGAIFHRRLVDTGIGVGARNAVAVGRDGIYFIGERGVYVTDGGEPVLLSELVEPIFKGGESTFFQDGARNSGVVGITPDALATASICWYDDKLYIGYATYGNIINNRTLVLDLLSGWWALWTIPSMALGVFGGELHMIGPSTAPGGAYAIWRYDQAVLADAAEPNGTGGVPFTARWRSGWEDYGSSDLKVIRETKVWGKGNVTLSRAVDFETGYRKSKLLALGATVDGKLARLGVRGTMHSFGLEGPVGGVDPRWAVHRLVHHLVGTEPSSITERDR